MLRLACSPGGVTSDSELDDAPDSKVSLPQNFAGRGMSVSAMQVIAGRSRSSRCCAVGAQAIDALKSPRFA